MKTNEPTLPPTLGGIERDTVMLVAGFCTALSLTNRFEFNKAERMMLADAGKALHEAALRLYEPQ